MTDPRPWPPPPSSNPLRALVAAQTWLSTTHLLTDWFIGLGTFLVTVLGLVFSVAFLPLFGAGAAVFVMLAYLTAGIGVLERGRYRLTLDVHIPAPVIRLPEGPSVGWWRRLRARLTSNVLWRGFGYQLVLMPVGVVTTTATVAIWSVPAAMIGMPFYVGALPTGQMDLRVFAVSGGPLSWVIAALGAVLLLAAPYLVHGLATIDAALGRLLLGPLRGSELQARVGQLEKSRSRLVDAGEAERRRIERDLHDGAQQQLVSLAMTLGRAKARLDEDPELARALIEQAHGDAKQAIVELRNLTRGIHPPVLTDLGLDAALSALAARCPVPVAVDVQAEPRCSPTIEAIAYFVVAEALTNVARHAQATAVSLLVRRDGRWLRLVVSDNGVGGADHAAGGTGLAGLADRLAAVDGRITVDSPSGGPTVLVAELPCAS